jgi:hypothetical protein
MSHSKSRIIIIDIISVVGGEGRNLTFAFCSFKNTQTSSVS